VCISIFGQVQTVTIGTQVLMTKNLDVSTFRNGEIIPEAKTTEEWEAAGKNKQPVWCYYRNDPKNGTKYGKLYNYYAVNDSRGLAPAGWHIPTYGEWDVLFHFLGVENRSDEALFTWEYENAKTIKMSPLYGPTKISYVDEGGYYDRNWVACSNCKVASSEYKKICPSCKGMGGRYVQGNYIPKTKRKVETKENFGWDGDNSSGFSALPGGYRNRAYCSEVGESAYWWVPSDSEYSFYRGLGDYDNRLWEISGLDDVGLSVRCVNDNEAVANGSGGKNGAGNGTFSGSGNEDGGLGKGNGEPRVRISNVSLPQYDIDYTCNIHLHLTVNANGEVVAAKSIKSKTTCTDQLIINQVINEVMKQVKYKKEIGAGLVNILYTVKIIAN
jgi:uncharacterized protein (TIGR02145 family)